MFDTKNGVFLKNRKLSNNKYKVVSYIDGTCFTCAQDFVLWKDFLKSVEDIDSVDFIFYFHTNDLTMFEPYFKRWRFNRSIYIDKKDDFKNVNLVAGDNKHLQTFLIDKTNKIIDIGTPIYDAATKAKYLKKFGASKVE